MTTAAVPQREHALIVANRVRSLRARIKRDLASRPTQEARRAAARVVYAGWPPG